MKRHVLDQLPFWVEGDLNPAEYAATENHLAQCPPCREAAEELRDSQSWLRESMAAPFDANDQDRLRRHVMDQIRAEAAPKPFRRFVTRPALLAASAAALLMATFTWRQEHPVAPAPTLNSQPSLPPLSHPPMVAPVRTHSTSVRAAPRHARLTPAEVPPMPHEEPARIEIQTPNPSIRIIWLAQAKPLPDINPIPQEAP